MLSICRLSPSIPPLRWTLKARVSVPSVVQFAAATRGALVTLGLAILVVMGAHPGIAMAALPGVGVTVVDSATKLRPADPLPVGAKTIRLEGARNEFEMAQLVLSSAQSVSDVFARVSPLVGPGGEIAATDIDLFLLHYVNVETASDGRGQAGSWPDALVPLKRPFAIKAGRLQALMLKVFLRPGLAPGAYRGTLTVTVGAAREAIEVTVEAWDVTLPERVGLPVMVGVDYESIRKFEGRLPDPAFEDKVVSRYYEALGRQRAYPLFLHNGIPEVRESAGGPVVSFETYERRLALLFQGKPAGPVGIPFFESWPIDTARHPMFSVKYRELAIKYLRQMASFYERKGMLERAFVYIPGTDEPTKKEQYAQVRQFADIVRGADPRLRMLQTAFMECLDCSGEGIETLEHPSVLWVPNLAFFDNRALRARLRLFGLAGVDYSQVQSKWTPAFTERVRQRGGDIWWYLNPWTSVLPKPHPTYANLYIDRPGLDQRVLGWMAFKYRIGALAHWNATFWQKTPDPWTRLARGEEAEGNPPTVNGDGSLFYPALGSSTHTGQPDPERPVASLRLEMLREASEDYELLATARREGKAALADEVVGTLVRSLVDYEQAPSAYQTARRRLATEIAAAKVASPRSPPSAVKKP